jgi:hypothetical protein
MTGPHSLAGERGAEERDRGTDADRGKNPCREPELSMLSSITRHDILNQVSAIVVYLALIEEISSDQETLEYVKKIGHLTELIQKQIAFTP